MSLGRIGGIFPPGKPGPNGGLGLIGFLPGFPNNSLKISILIKSLNVGFGLL